MTEMRLWLLRPRGFKQDEEGSGSAGHYALEGGPWDPWYDKTFGFIVRAGTEQRARELADAHPMDEARDKHFNKRPIWTDAALVECTELVADGEEGIVMRDDAYA